MTNAQNVRVGITGAVYKAPPGTPLPTSSTAALNAAYRNLGFVSEDGIEENWEDSVDDIIAWQNASNVRSVTTGSVLSLALTLIETTGAVLEMFHRGSTMTEPTAGNFRLDVKPVVADPSLWVLDVVDGLKIVRLSVGNGEIVERGAVQYKNGEPVAYPVTLRGYPDAAGNIVQKFSTDAAWDVP